MRILQRYGFVLAILGILASPSTLAFEIPEGVRVVTAPEVRNMLTNGEVLLVHTLSRIEYAMQHIPQSINIPVDKIGQSPDMPLDMDAPIVFYCNGVACPYSRRASKIAVQLGYNRVHWFRGGILDWRRFQYELEIGKELSSVEVPKLAPAEFRELAYGDVMVLDVRPCWWRQSAEQAGVIEGTDAMIPLIELDKQLDLLPKDRPILLVDRLMRQSVAAARFLKKNGFHVLGVLRGGARRWVREGLPILERQDEPPMPRSASTDRTS